MTFFIGHFKTNSEICASLVEFCGCDFIMRRWETGTRESGKFGCFTSIFSDSDFVFIDYIVKFGVKKHLHREFLRDFAIEIKESHKKVYLFTKTLQ